MDCMRSFVIDASLNQSWALGPNLDVWTIGTNNYWFGRTSTAFAQFDVRGFKNINIFGIDCVGDFKSGPGGNQCLIDNWEVSIDLIGQPQIIGGTVTPITNLLNVNQEPAFINNFILSKYKRGFELSSPIQSVNGIQFQAFTASGHANQSLLNVTVNWNLNFIFYYKFEGE